MSERKRFKNNYHIKVALERADVDVHVNQFGTFRFFSLLCSHSFSSAKLLRFVFVMQSAFGVR